MRSKARKYTYNSMVYVSTRNSEYIHREYNSDKRPLNNQNLIALNVYPYVCLRYSLLSNKFFSLSIRP